MLIYADEMCSGRNATCPSMVLWAGVIALYLEEMLWSSRLDSWRKGRKRNILRNNTRILGEIVINNCDKHGTL